VQYASKMLMRTVPLVKEHYNETNEVPELMALGFAAFLLFMRSKMGADNHYYGESNGSTYRIQDDKASLLYHKWNSNKMDTLTKNVLQDTTIFGTDLTHFPGFAEAVDRYLALLMQSGAKNALRSILAKKSVA